MKPRTRTPKENPEQKQALYGAGKFPTGQASSVRGRHETPHQNKFGAGQAWNIKSET